METLLNLAQELEKRGSNANLLRELEEARELLEAERKANEALAEEVSRLREQLKRNA